ncbi:MAG: aminodeoxychorismate/anthranilate synthase component II [Fimbriimonadaceae bacterium]|nr:aminodeoxychorismate/anthranilate synthase component II [Chitinophagales bacterium]
MIFLLDNYDSFTYNLYDYLSQIGSKVLVERNNKITVEQIKQLSPQAIVISPGPKTPKDAGILMEVIHHFHKTIPLLGICLGYQGIGEYFGATLIKSKIPVHGKTSVIHFDAEDVFFENIPLHTEVMRYHSLNIKNIPASLKVIAQTQDAEPMALKHIQLPVYGVQFHPESVLTLYGFQMLHNWYHACVLTHIKV